ncbi:hypothetical protein ACFX13_022429 [Malus domestica]
MLQRSIREVVDNKVSKEKTVANRLIEFCYSSKGETIAMLSLPDIPVDELFTEAQHSGQLVIFFGWRCLGGLGLNKVWGDGGGEVWEVAQDKRDELGNSGFQLSDGSETPVEI